MADQGKVWFGEMSEMIKNWEYRGEGNGSVVISNVRRGVVYRMEKTICDPGPAKKRIKLDYEASRQKIQRLISYVDEVMAPKLGTGTVHSGMLVELPAGFVQSLAEALESQRPEHRKCKELDVDCPFAVQLPDFCIMPPRHTLENSAKTETSTPSPSITVEIKPKWGYLPTTSLLSEEREIKHTVCRFCMFQYLKLKSSKWKDHSRYCPIDLFSGNPSRMKHALKMLLATPQNNLRVFKNGHLLFSEEQCSTDYASDINRSLQEQDSAENLDNAQVQSLDYFVDLLTKCLLHVTEDRDQADDGHRSTEHPEHPRRPQTCRDSTYVEVPETDGPAGKHKNHKSYATGLPVGSVLNRLLHAQWLDDLDIEGLFPLYQQVAKHFKDKPEARQASHMEGPYSAKWCSLTDNLDKNSIEYAITKVKEYLVSRTAKDCSLMITLQPIANSQLIPSADDDSAVVPDSRPSSTINDLQGRKFNLATAVIDLDPKSFDKIPFYMKEDEEVVQCYQSRNEGNGSNAKNQLNLQNSLNMFPSAPIVQSATE